MTIIILRSVLEEKTFKYKLQKETSELVSLISGVASLSGTVAFIGSKLDLVDVNPTLEKVILTLGIAGAIVFLKSFSEYCQSIDNLDSIDEMEMSIAKGNTPLVSTEDQIDEYIDSLTRRRRSKRKELSKAIRYGMRY